MGINDLADSYYQEWTYEDRKELEFTCQSGFLLSVVVVQWVAAVQARSRKLAFLLIYMPGNTEGLQLGPLWSIVWWLPGLAFSIVLLSYEELRKAISRKHPGAWVDTETRY